MSLMLFIILTDQQTAELADAQDEQADKLLVPRHIGNDRNALAYEDVSDPDFKALIEPLGQTILENLDPADWPAITDPLDAQE